MVALFDSSSEGSVVAGTSVTFSHIVASQSDRVLVVGVNTGDGAIAVTGITFNGTSMTQFSAYNSNAQKIFVLAAPDVGTFNIVATLSASGNCAAVSAGYYDADQVTPAENATNAFGENAGNVTSRVGDRVIHFVGDSAGLTEASWTNDQTLLNEIYDNPIFIGGQDAAGAALVNMTSTVVSPNNQMWSMAASVRAVGALISAITDPVLDGSTGNTLTVANFGSDISTLTFKDTASGTHATTCTIASGTGNGPYSFSVPDVAAFIIDTLGTPFGAITNTAGDGTDTADLSSTYDPKAGWSVSIMGASPSTIEGSVHYLMAWTPVAGGQVYTPDTIIVDVAGIFTSDITTGSVLCQYFDPSDSKWKPFYIQFEAVAGGAGQPSNNLVNQFPWLWN